MWIRYHLRGISTEKVSLFTLVASLILVVIMTWIGAFPGQGDPELGTDHWFFEGLRMAYAVFEGDSMQFREYAGFFPFLAVILPVLVPVSTVSAVLALFWNYLPHHIPCFNRIWYVFSELTPNSIRMAKNIQKELKSNDTGIFIFLRTSRAKLDPELLSSIRDLNYFLSPKNEECFLKWPWRQKRILRFFFLSSNTDSNFSRLKYLIDAIQDKSLLKPVHIHLPEGQFQHELYLLSETESAPMLIDHLRGKMKDDNNRRLPMFSHTELRLLDRFRAISYNLLKDAPLPIQSGTDTNVLLLGFGKIGREFFRAASSVCITHNNSLHFTLCDLEVSRKLNAFSMQYPELHKSVSYDVVEFNAECSPLKCLVESKKYHYIVVALGNDERNIRVSSWLKRYYRKHHWKHLDIQTPQICVNIEDEIKREYTTELWTAKPKHSWDKSVHIFGGLDDSFSPSVLMPQKLWKQARSIHKELNRLKQDTPLDWSEYERRSSIACAAHINHNLTLTHENHPDLKKLADTEHRRWMTYVRSEGLQHASLDMLEVYFTELGNHHVDVLGRLSPCLVDTKDLEIVQKKVDELRQQNNLTDPSYRISFRERDRMIAQYSIKSDQTN